MDSALNAIVAAKTFNTSLPEDTKTLGPADPESDDLVVVWVPRSSLIAIPLSSLRKNTSWHMQTTNSGLWTYFSRSWRRLAVMLCRQNVMLMYVLITKTTVASATTVIGEDTDLLVPLICHADPESHPLYMQSDKKKGKKFRVWDIHWFQRSPGTEMYSLLPFANVIGGCDTTSHLFGIDIGVPLRKLNDDQNFRKQAHVYSSKATME